MAKRKVKKQDRVKIDKDKTKIFDYVEKLIEEEKRKLGDYPVLIKLPKETLRKLKIAIKELAPKIDSSWANKPDNYRGIGLREA